ncbi:MAG: hypothetical protein ACYDBQ_08505 [Thermoplasmatota archaeon]
MRPIFPVALTLILAAGCASQPQNPLPTGGLPVAIPFGFGNVTLVDDGTVGVSEPSIMTDYQGNLWISGPTGLVTPAIQHNPQPYTHDTSMFKSTDGGKTWTNMQQVPGYGRDACPGGGDSDIAASPDGAVYLIDLYLGNVPIDVSTDGGHTWTFNCYTSIYPGVDRQWVAASNQHVWIAVNQQVQGAEIYRSDKLGLPTDGLVFGAPQFIPGNGPLKVDQKDGTLYVAASGASVLVSTDAGATFTSHDTGLKGHDLSGSFVSLALDASGDVFVAGAGKQGIVISGSRDHGKSWTPGVVFAPYRTTGGGEYAFAWVTAGGNGTVDMAWYGQKPHANGTAYYVFALQKENFLNDPSNATYAWTQVTQNAIATKPLCQGINLVPPTPCDADGTHTRALGDFFESGVDAKGHMVIAFDDANGHSPPELKFAIQSVGTLAPPAK